jgi:D-3-phosphoglycerate dehydrogenase
MPKKVLITVSPIYRLAVDRVRARLQEAGCEVHYLGRPDEQLQAAELLELLREVEIYLVGNARVPRPVIEGSPSLALICKFGVGVDNIDLAAAAERGVLVTNAPGCNAISVAEMTIGLIIALWRRLKETERSLRDGQWRAIPGDELYGRVLGIVGLGNIGKEVARRARAFGMRVLSHDIVDYADFCRQFEVEATSFEAVLSQSDVLSLHVPLTPLTRHMIGEAQLRRMKHGAILIHTARGGVADEAALCRALAGQHLAGAALDVFETEPLGPSRLRSLDNVILTPHVAGITYQAADRIGERTVANVLAYLAGSRPPDLLTPTETSAGGRYP